ncbi:glutamine--fructose-6-phosphate transaminase (isomerizing) [Clostridia bacterium]|nr:glutamine--fructose-6-phosphate transaminase (isomerizing) [Clostridia bacterium]
MCGIVGYLGSRSAQEVLLQGLEKLEYRGYDSAGIAVMQRDGLKTGKKKGRLDCLKNAIADEDFNGTMGIGHTRWATHGKPSDENSHPHNGSTTRFAVVHNGIIENYQELKKMLIEKGHEFSSETDTEVIPHLLEENYQGDFKEAMRTTVAQLDGSYAICAMSSEDSDTMITVRKDSPLIVGIGEHECFVASDIPAVLKYTKDIMVFEDGEMAVITSEGIKVYSAEGDLINKPITKVDWDMEAAEKGGFPHFMLKEIFEQPEAIRKTLAGRLDGDLVKLNLSITAEELKKINKVVVIACGTASYAGRVGRTLIEKILRIPVSVDVASEFRYMDPIVDENTLALIISQSGETADTLAGLKEARSRGAKVISITNVVGSSIARESDEVIYTQAGPEIAVASTKAYVTQLIAIYLLTLHLGRIIGSISEEKIGEMVRGIRKLPDQIQKILERKDELIAMAAEIKDSEHVFFIGRGVDFTASLEGALKLKEISYIHAEAYAAGELKHGTLALIEEGTPVIAISTQSHLREKTISNIKEIKARGASVYSLCFEGCESMEAASDGLFVLPTTQEILAPVVTVVPLQLLAYYVSVARGNDVDKPRNLAKSVTVE